MYLHGEGNFLESYERFGAHMMTVDGVEGVHFAVWAPNALRASVVGPFNLWDNRANVMQMHGESGVWETFILNCRRACTTNTRSRHGVRGRQGRSVRFYFEVRPTTDSPASGTSTNMAGATATGWRIAPSIRHRIGHEHLRSPSRQLAARRGQRLPQLSRTGSPDGGLREEMATPNIELLPVTEHPFDGSWGHR